MKILFLLFSAILCVPAQAENPKLNCDSVKIDAKFGAEKARSGDSVSQALESLERSRIDINNRLAKRKIKLMSNTDVAEMKASFLGGYNEALRLKDETTEVVAAQAFLKCMFEKYKQ